MCRNVAGRPKYPCVLRGGITERNGAFPAARGAAPQGDARLSCDYLRRIARLEAMPENASGTDTTSVHKAHADAVRLPQEVRGMVRARTTTAHRLGNVTKRGGSARRTGFGCSRGRRRSLTRMTARFPTRWSAGARSRARATGLGRMSALVWFVAARRISRCRASRFPSHDSPAPSSRRPGRGGRRIGSFSRPTGRHSSTCCPTMRRISDVAGQSSPYFEWRRRKAGGASTCGTHVEARSGQ